MATGITVFAAILFLGVGATAETTNALSDAEIQGRQLAQKILEQRPTENFTDSGVLKIRDEKGNTTNLPIEFRTILTASNWLNTYEIPNKTNNGDPIYKLTVKHLHFDTYSNEYCADEFIAVVNGVGTRGGNFYTTNSGVIHIPLGSKIMAPFAGSDFWIADLGLEFFQIGRAHV